MHRIHPHHLTNNSQWDVIIIGGGATGLGIAVDSASRGLKTLLVEQADFAKGTSSRSTKLVHGGVRYLAQGNIKLVRQALKERGRLQKNAAHLVHKQEFIIPCYSWPSVIKYFIGLKIYDWLAGQFGFGPAKFFSKEETLKLMPGIKKQGLKGAVRYYDGRFDDARLAINLVQTAKQHGATLINYMKTIALIKEETHVKGIVAQDILTQETFHCYSKVVINATGVFVDDIIGMASPHAKKTVKPSQGIHIVLNKGFLHSNLALMIPKTSDGRILFAIPWHKHLLVGTTDTPLNQTSIEPVATQQEIDFILDTTAQYFVRKPTKQDVLSVFAGLRPLAAGKDDHPNSTKEISRDHKLITSAPGLITITGGKWTTYRRMAEETVNLAIKQAQLPYTACQTKQLPIHGCRVATDDNPLNSYGLDRIAIEALIKQHPPLGQKLHPHFPYTHAEVVWATRHEMAETVEDILSRRLRVLMIDTKAALEMCPTVAAIMAIEIGANKNWEEAQINAFKKLTESYLLTSYH